jgi:hypothetical protein
MLRGKMALMMVLMLRRRGTVLVMLVMSPVTMVRPRSLSAWTSGLSAEEVRIKQVMPFFYERHKYVVLKSFFKAVH